MKYKFYTRCLFAFVCAYFSNLDAHGKHIVDVPLKAATNMLITSMIPAGLTPLTYPVIKKTYYPKGLQATAYHEAAHAVIAHKVSPAILIDAIVVDKEAGWVLYEKPLHAETEEEIQNFIFVLLAGAAAEYEFNCVRKSKFISFDACYKELYRNYAWSYDLKDARKAARILLQKKHPDRDEKLDCQEIDRILQESYRRTIMLVHEQRSDIQAVAFVVLKKEKISGKEFYSIMRKQTALPAVSTKK